MVESLIKIHFKFTAQSYAERIYQVNWHLAKLHAKTSFGIFLIYDSLFLHHPVGTGNAYVEFQSAVVNLQFCAGDNTAKVTMAYETNSLW